MEMTKEEILHAKSSREVLRWMKQFPENIDPEVAALFNKLAREEFRERYPEYKDGDYIDLNPREETSSPSGSSE